ncbi:hypothetical protein PX554_19875 [Sphingomonas sp. H39-1-10]|uniref:deazapurine DNA modification protein DpdA family protein n=1 Tax=Sphingomonas pollutisoli TaxID=3030829 RepID=UPI0023B91CC6|nr:hypothetical protein [Sphingomonas pollutisoli]MDF0490391.1 hypothetical protein [Sphingomonas pollutisoli]
MHEPARPLGDIPNIEIIVGLPHLRSGALLERARHRRYPVLVSANAFSCWDRSAGYPVWRGWNLKSLANAAGLVSIDLDSAGFVLASRYRGLPWSVDDYVALAASHPFRRWASLDLCVEEEIARNRDEVLDRIARTVALNHACHVRALDAGNAASFMPVLQGREPGDYLRCLDRMHGLLRPGMTLGVGSMCRRPIHGSEGLLAVLSALDRALPDDIRLHLFGVKGLALGWLAPLARRVASIDSAAFGVAARREAHARGQSKTDAFVADHMDRWTGTQLRRLELGKAGFQHELLLSLPLAALSPWETALAGAREEIRALIETGEIGPDQITEGWIAQWAADSDQDQPTENS